MQRPAHNRAPQVPRQRGTSGGTFGPYAKEAIAMGLLLMLMLVLVVLVFLAGFAWHPGL